MYTVEVVLSTDTDASANRRHRGHKTEGKTCRHAAYLQSLNLAV